MIQLPPKFQDTTRLPNTPATHISRASQGATPLLTAASKRNQATTPLTINFQDTSDIFVIDSSPSFDREALRYKPCVTSLAFSHPFSGLEPARGVTGGGLSAHHAYCENPYETGFWKNGGLSTESQAFFAHAQRAGRHAQEKSFGEKSREANSAS